MELTQILAQLNTEDGTPADWIVLPLLRRKVLMGIIGWSASFLFGGLLFALLVSIMIPHNYQAGFTPAILSTLLLGVALYICLGGLWVAVTDILRLRNAEQYMIIITPDTFVKREGKKTIYVPLEHVKHITARGETPVDRSLETAREDGRINSSGENLSSLVVGRRLAGSGSRGLGRKRTRIPTTLAFIDGRTGSEVIVLTDKSYGDPHFIAAQITGSVLQCQAKMP